MFPYIDDIFHAQISKELVISARNTSVHLHLQRGFVLNLTKSSLVPSEVMLHLGSWIDTFNGLVKPSLDKTQAITLAYQDLLSQGSVSVRRLQTIVGLLASCHATVPLCLFRLRPISTHLSRNFRRRSDSTSKVIPLDVLEVLEALWFWADPSQVAEGVPLGFQPVKQILTTDTSNHG